MEIFMKTYILLLFLLLNSFPLFSKTIKKPATTPYFFSIVSTIGGVSSISGGAPNHTSPTLWLNLEWAIPVGVKNFYLYTQFRNSFFIGKSSDPFSSLLPIIHMENFKMGFLLGFGGVVGDWRNTEKKGSYITFNSGFVFEGSYHNGHVDSQFIPIESSLLESFYNIGFEINSRYQYSFGKYQTLSVGFTMGYLYNPISGDPFYLGLHKNIVSFHMLYYGISFAYNF